MIKVVLDANILVSALMKPRSIPARILEAVRQSQILLVFSRDTLLEVWTVLKYPKVERFHGLTNSEIDAFVAALADLSLVTPGRLRVEVIEDDPSDNMYLSCAVEGGANYIISGDKHLRNLRSHHGIPILSPAEFLMKIQ